MISIHRAVVADSVVGRRVPGSDLTEVASRLRVLPATLDGTAIDTRTRFRLSFTIQ